MRFALLSDLHCWSVNLLPWRLMGKRAVGMSNLLMFRMNRFSQKVVERNVNKAAALNVDHVLFAGDATQTSLLREFQNAKKAFDPVRDRLLAVPGNHDYYTTGTLIYRRFERVFLNMPDFPKSDENASDQFIFNEYPWVKNISNEVKIVGMNCAYPSFQAFGTVKAKQLRKLEAEIEDAKSRNQKLIILNHFQYAYPDNIKVKSSHKLYNAAKLIKVLQKAPKAVYIHGHIHKPWIITPEITPDVLCISAISSGMQKKDKPLGLGFYEMEFDRDDVIIHKHEPVSKDEWKTEIVVMYEDFWKA